jgi:transposase
MTQDDDPTPKGPVQRQPRTTKEQRRQISDLRKAGYGMRKIADRVGCDRKTVRAALEKAGLLGASLPPERSKQPKSKLDGFTARIKEKVDKGLTVTRIHRELREVGYTGGRTILANHVSKTRPPRASTKKIRRRFTTNPGKEMQIDWSPYQVPIAGKVTTVHAFGALLHHSRKTHVRFYENERQSTLLEAHEHAFDDFGGVTQRLVYDRMATVVLGTIPRSGKPIWHPRFVEFAKHYAFEPFLCRARDPDRKGAVESVFRYLEPDFVRGSSFASLEEMNARVREWLDKVANARRHGTTGNIPDEAWLLERDLLIALPDAPYPVFDEDLRQVAMDSTLSVRGTSYTVPWPLANRTVTVRLYHRHFEVLGLDGTVALRRAYAEGDAKGRLHIEPEHYDGMPRGPEPPGAQTARQLEDGLLMRFPSIADLVVGIKLRMKGLAHVHLRLLSRMAAQYGDDAFRRAAEAAQSSRANSAHSVRRCLERDHPVPPCENVAPLNTAASAHALDEIESGSLDDYADLDDGEDGNDGQ